MEAIPALLWFICALWSMKLLVTWGFQTTRRFSEVWSIAMQTSTNKFTQQIILSNTDFIQCNCTPLNKCNLWMSLESNRVQYSDLTLIFDTETLFKVIAHPLPKYTCRWNMCQVEPIGIMICIKEMIWDGQRQTLSEWSLLIRHQQS